MGNGFWPLLYNNTILSAKTCFNGYYPKLPCLVIFRVILSPVLSKYYELVVLIVTIIPSIPIGITYEFGLFLLVPCKCSDRIHSRRRQAANIRRYRLRLYYFR